MLADLKGLKQELELHSKIQRAIYPDTGGGKNLTTSGTRVEVQTADEMELSTGGTGMLRTQSSAEFIISQFKVHKTRAVFTSLIVLAVAAGIGYGLFRLLGVGGVSHFQNVRIRRLITNGRISGGAALAPDGRYVAYVEIDAGQQNLYLRQLATSSSVLIASGKGIDKQLTFSPDGNYLYYVAKTKDDSKPSLYMMPLVGGVSQKLVSGVNSFAAVSPDGQRLAFVRYNENPKIYSIIVMNADGSNERKVASRTAPEYYVSTAWSPDGKRLACAGGGRNDQGFYGELVEIDLEGGDPRPLTDRRWRSINTAVWLADGNSLIMTAEGPLDGVEQIWQISYPGGEPRRITTDMNEYVGLRVTRDSRTLVSTKIGGFRHLYIQRGYDAAPHN
jgi:Tol biopolymer transport system component